jgi:hypothetical protein
MGEIVDQAAGAARTAGLRSRAFAQHELGDPEREALLPDAGLSGE